MQRTATHDRAQQSAGLAVLQQAAPASSKAAYGLLVQYSTIHVGDSSAVSETSCKQAQDSSKIS